MVQIPSIAQVMPAVSNDSVTLTNVPQQPSMTQIPSIAQAPVSLIPPVQPVPPVMGQPVYYSTQQYMSGPDVLVQTAASLLQPKTML